MDNIVDSLDNSYQDFVAAVANVMEANEASGGLKTPTTDAALEDFKQSWELFRVAYDQTDEFVESVQQRIGSECLVDKASKKPMNGNLLGTVGTTTGLPPISAVRLEQMSKAVRCLVMELQQGAGGASDGATGHGHRNAPYDTRFLEDAAE